MPDTPEMLALALLKAAVTVGVDAARVVTKGAQNVRTEARNNALQSAPTRNARAPYAIGYDLSFRPSSFGATIGYDKDMPGGALGNLLEFGGGADHSPPHRDLGRALDSEEPRFLRAMANVARDVIPRRR